MDAPKKTELQYGYYKISFISEKIPAQHTYGKTKDGKVEFHCYGGVSGDKHVHPGKFFLGLPRGTSYAVDLKLAKYIAANGRKGYEARNIFNERPDPHWIPTKNWGDCSGLCYALTGVCHQMLNAICTASRDGPLTWVNNAPTFYASWLAFSCFGLPGGVTGRGFPPRLKRLHSKFPNPIPEGVTMDSELTALVLPSPESERLAVEGVRHLFGEDISDAACMRITEAQHRVQDARVDCQRDLLMGKASPDDYANSFNAAVRTEVEASLDALPKDYASLVNTKLDFVQTELMMEGDAYMKMGEQVEF